MTGSPPRGDEHSDIPALTDDAAAAKVIAFAQFVACAEYTWSIPQRVRCWGFVVGGGLGYNSPAPEARPDVAGDIDVGGPVAELALGSGQICALLDSGS